ncbi:DDE-type integrase/transposase/recombinase, partial [Streptomyces sp. NPDC059616]|uniref:DDE-type integrase/transposase/recombinase n=1 Tax=Streptomyces sp. NPDC059616 TaxID=3346886 RepID=UPI0036AA9497
VHAELRGFGHTVNHKRVARLMRKHGIVGRHLRTKKRTTIPDRLAPPVADLVQRDFTASTLDEKWCSDITYVQVGAAWLYLACVIDIRSHRVLGWSMAPRMRAELVIDALQAAVATRGGNVTGVIFHADRGSQYTSAAFAQVCDLPAERERSWKHDFTNTLLAAVDRTLFTHKAARRAGGGQGGVIAVTRPPLLSESDQAGSDPLVLLPLPAAADIVHVVARPDRIGGRDFLLLPCRGPVGQRGAQLRVTFPTGSAKTVVAYALRGQAAVPYVAVTDGVIGVPLTVQGVRDHTPRSVPEALAAALERAGLDWMAVPAHEQAQILHLITEAGSKDIRAGRVTAAVDAVAARNGTSR